MSNDKEISNNILNEIFSSFLDLMPLGTAEEERELVSRLVLRVTTYATELQKANQEIANLFSENEVLKNEIKYYKKLMEENETLKAKSNL